MNYEYSAGGLILRKIDNQLQVLLVEHRDNTYVFPKGHIEAGETPPAAAAREIQEETGLLHFKIKEKIDNIIRRPINKNGEEVTKIITMFKVEVADFDQTTPTEETTKWFPTEEAIHYLRYDEDKKFLVDYLNKS